MLVASPVIGIIIFCKTGKGNPSGKETKFTMITKDITEYPTVISLDNNLNETTRSCDSDMSSFAYFGGGARSGRFHAPRLRR
jgi:hypothetical protein